MEPFMCTGILSCGAFANQSYSQDYSLSVRGGASGVNYFISGSFADAQGMVANDTQQRYSLRSNLTLSPTNDLQIQWNTSYVNLALTTTAGQNNAQGITLNAFRQERNYFGTGDPEVLSELLEQDITEDVERFTTGITVNYSPTQNLTNRFILGYDWSQREHRSLRPYGWHQVPQGALLNNTFQNRVLSLDYVGTYQFDLSDQLRSSFSWGGQAIGDDDRLLEGFGTNFPGAAVPTVSSAAERLAFEDRSKIWNAGFFLQNVLDVSNKYFLTLGVRVDGNSAFGSGFGLQVYPKGQVAYVLSDEDFYPDWGEVKLRFAYGQSGRAPGAFDAVRTWSPEGLAGIPAFVPDNVGNPDIGPEVTTEMEGGFDASWLDSRLTTNFTYYRQITDDALFRVAQIPSGGFTSSRITNIGQIKNSGMEIQVNGTVFQGSDWGLDLGLNFSTNHSEIMELNDPNLETGCFKVGYPLRARCNEKIANPDAIVNSLSEVLFVEPGDPDFVGDGTRAREYFYGPNLPTTFISPSITLRVPKGITLNARGDYKGGFYMNEQVFAIGRSVRSPLCFPYYSDPENSNALKADIPAIWYSRCNTSDTEGYMWDASFFKIRSISATIPVRSNSVLTIALNNSFLWMKEMPFMDPEASADPGNNTGPQQGYNFEEVVPAPISLRLSLRVTW
jgi:outer membrane receptor protein involved in Fe transport